MSLFGNIVSKIFGHSAEAAPATAPTVAPTSETAASASAGTAAVAEPVDVEAVLTELATHKHEKLDWRKSIVDLMMLLDLDSSHAARTELAKELHYAGNTEDSAAMNIWLHKEVMRKLAENGGKVPDELKH